jgi:hypothetical protein
MDFNATTHGQRDIDDGRRHQLPQRGTIVASVPPRV